MAIELIPDNEAEPSSPLAHLREEPTFDSLAANLPEDASGFLDEPPPPSPAVQETPGDAGIYAARNEGDEPAPPPRKRKSLKKLQKALERFEEQIADWPVVWFHQRAKDNPEWELDAKEVEFMKDAISTVFEVLDIGVDIAPLSYTITSVYWVLLYPFAAFFFLFITKKSATMDKEQANPDAQ